MVSSRSRVAPLSGAANSGRLSFLTALSGHPPRPVPVGGFALRTYPRFFFGSWEPFVTAAFAAVPHDCDRNPCHRLTTAPHGAPAPTNPILGRGGLPNNPAHGIYLVRYIAARVTTWTGGNSGAWRSRSGTSSSRRAASGTSRLSPQAIATVSIPRPGAAPAPISSCAP